MSGHAWTVAFLIPFIMGCASSPAQYTFAAEIVDEQADGGAVEAGNVCEVFLCQAGVQSKSRLPSVALPLAEADQHSQ